MTAIPSLQRSNASLHPVHLVTPDACGAGGSGHYPGRASPPTAFYGHEIDNQVANITKLIRPIVLIILWHGRGGARLGHPAAAVISPPA